MSDIGEYSLLMKFIDQNPSFAHGFECGILWEKLKKKEAINELINLENVEQVRNICRRYLYDFKLIPSNNGWYQLIATPNQYKEN